ncbi:MAG: NADH-quinone oxidoreductase subunit J [Gemmatimonadota bacterium]
MTIDFLFVLFAAMALMGALAMIGSRNPVASLMFLVLTFFAISGIFVLMEAHFLAAVQVIVYAGAILVLFLFVIMLLNLGHAEEADLRGLGGRLAAVLLGSASLALIGTLVWRGERTGVAGGMGEETIRAILRARGAVGAVAEPLYRSYLVPFEITSLVLLVAIVGAVVLARRKAP